jgi:hypothetical protein
LESVRVAGGFSTELCPPHESSVTLKLQTPSNKPTTNISQYAYDFDITVTAGDVIKVTVTATSLYAGTAVLENVTTGKTVTETFTNEKSLGELCEYNAEWIVEDFEEGNSLVSFADFGSVKFTSASATDSSGTVGTTGATIIDIKQNSVLTSCSLPSSSEVLCTYV